ncbi:hypothetical protein DL769_005870 [Monosporascus sp. CRB-8-3]|nr:hypothetical protein DL769_005870 [Monosporascus sp. CRB-8-3]
MNANCARKSWYTTQLKKWGFRKNLKDATARDCQIASYKVTKARKKGKRVDLYFHEQKIAPRVLRGERFFLSKLEEVELDNQKSPPRTPPGFHLVIHSRAVSPIPLDNENGLQSTIEQQSSSLLPKLAPPNVVAGLMYEPTYISPTALSPDEFTRLDSPIVQSLALDTSSVFTYPTSTDIGLFRENPSVYEYAVDDDGDQNIELARKDPISVVSHARSLYPDLAMIAPHHTRSPTLEFLAPAFSEFSDHPNRRALVDHFCNVLSNLFVFREETGNPFQQLVLPLSHNNSAVMNAIYALASAHLEYRGIQSGEKSLYFHNMAIQDLARLIQKDEEIDKNELLAAVMLLVYYEVVSIIFCMPRGCRG